MKSLNLSSYNLYIEKVLDEIECNLDHDLSIERLASLAGYSPFHFQRLFKDYVGESVHQYIKRLRVEKTALMLKYQYNNITDSAIRTGFNNNISLTRAFKSIYNCSPKEYKDQFRLNKKFDTPSFEVVNIDDLKVFFVRVCGDYNYSEKASWMEVENKFEQLSQNNLQYISICYNEPSITLDKTNLRYEACILYEKNKHSHISDLPVKIIRGGKYAKFSFSGTLDEFDNFFNIVFDTFYHDKNYQISLKPSFQFHHNSYKDLLFGTTTTDLFIPID
ncbi:hypothetical protein CPG38_07160 [Malaciobacter marinus]|uniref:AraC family transcriptional regulator n=1 Tax=Malaciobacter marinus TaxID=505249 RepID=UPI000C083DD1|nr:helix-turn-helix domain-containing protein [Malaciobacter marinus]PHO12616.1 hypothetical protein CPG38_07160 [Malaciobacter marinus]